MTVKELVSFLKKIENKEEVEVYEYDQELGKVKCHWVEIKEIIKTEDNKSRRIKIVYIY